MWIETDLCLPSQSVYLLFLFLAYWISKGFQYDVEKQWWEGSSLPYTRSECKSFNFFTINYEVKFLTLSIKLKKFTLDSWLSEILLIIDSIVKIGIGLFRLSVSSCVSFDILYLSGNCSSSSKSSNLQA